MNETENLAAKFKEILTNMTNIRRSEGDSSVILGELFLQNLFCKTGVHSAFLHSHVLLNVLLNYTCPLLSGSICHVQHFVQLCISSEVPRWKKNKLKLRRKCGSGVKRVK